MSYTRLQRVLVAAMVYRWAHTKWRGPDAGPGGRRVLLLHLDQIAQDVTVSVPIRRPAQHDHGR